LKLRKLGEFDEKYISHRAKELSERGKAKILIFSVIEAKAVIVATHSMLVFG